MWDRIRVWFHDSEVIAWSRLQMLVGAIWAVLVVSDLSPLLSTKWLSIWLIFSGVVTEIARRAREPHDLGVKTVADLSTVMLPIKAADAVSVNTAAGTVTVTKAADIPTDVVSKPAEAKP